MRQPGGGDLPGLLVGRPAARGGARALRRLRMDRQVLRMSAVPPSSIVCPDCGGPCGLLTRLPEDGPVPGDVLAYRCRDCNDRWDVVLDAQDLRDPQD